MPSFLDSLRNFTTEMRTVYSEGSSTVPKDVANEMSGLHMSFRGMWEGLPHAQRDTFRYKFTDEVLRFGQLQELLLNDVAPQGAFRDYLANSKKGLFQVLEAEGLMQGDATGQNKLYRFTMEGRKRLGTLVEQNAASLGIANNEVDAYMHYVSGLNMNLRPAGDVRISPGGHLTAEARDLMFPRYSSTMKGASDSLWNPKSRVNAVVFDIETGGGPASAANVNEVAARMVGIGGGQPMGFGDPMQERFSVNRMTLGTFADGSDASPLNLKFRQGSEDLFTSVAGDGRAFAGQVKPILKQMAGADAILGQNIIGFDIDHLIGNVMRTSPYLQGTDTELVDLVGTIKGKMQQPGYVIDTLEMLREYEAIKDTTLSTSKLMPSGEKTTRSIQNVLLNTNLIDYMRQQKVGADSLWDIANAGGGHHTAAFDTTVTAALYQSMVEQKLELNQLPTIHGPNGVGVRAIKDIVSSTAFTPASNIRDPADILDKTWATMYQRGLETQGEAFRLVPVDPRDTSLKPIIPTGAKGELEQMINMVSSDERYRLHMDATYAEQTSIHTRNLTGAARLIDDTDELYPLAGGIGDAWGDLTRMADPYAGTLNQDGSIFKAGAGWNIDEFTEYQKRIAGLPYSNIGLPERNLTMAAVYGSRIGTAKENLAMVHGGALSALDVVPELGSSYWRIDPQLLKEGAPGIIKTSNQMPNTTLSMTIDTARKLNKVAIGNLFDVDLAEDAMPMLEVNLGRFDTGSFANLQMNMLANPNLSAEGRRAVINEILDMDDIDDDMKTLLVNRIKGKSDSPLKVTVGSLTDESADMLIEAYGQTEYGLQGGATLRAQLLETLETDVAPGERRGALHIGALTLGDAHTARERAVLDQHAGRALQLGQALREETSSVGFLQAERDVFHARQVKRGAGPAVPPNYGVLEYQRAKARVGGAVNAGYDRIAGLIEASGVTGGRGVSVSLLKKMTIPAAALGLFAAFVGRDKEEQLYDQTFEQGPTVSNGYYSTGISSADPIHKRIRPRINPLATGNLAFDAYDNRIGHTRPPGRM